MQGFAGNYFGPDQLLAIRAEKYFENPAKVVKYILEFLNVSELSTQQLQDIVNLARANSMSDPSSLKTKDEAHKREMASTIKLLPTHMLNETHAVMAEFFEPFQERLRTALGHAHAMRMKAAFETNRYAVDIGY